ncbi:tetratricopeptide repeat protein [Methylocella silvestris]|nr:tetratricopeptide repeat protein [Methylocella silvestris]
MRKLILVLLIGAPLAGLYVWGRPVAGHLLFVLGFPSAAAEFFQDSSWKGTALYSAGRWSEAAQAFGATPENAYNRGNAFARDGRYAEAVKAYEAAISFDPDNEDAAANRELVASLLSTAGGDGGEKKGGVANADATRQIHAPRATPELSEATSTGSGLVGTVQSKSTGPDGAGSAPKTGVGDPGAAREGAGKATGSAGNAEGEGRAGGVMVDITKLMAARDLRARRRLESHAVLATRDWLDALPDDPGAFLKLHILSEQARRKAGAPEASEDD